MKQLLSLVIIGLVLTSCKTDVETNLENTTDVSISEQVAQASGIDQWEDVKQVKFTFNVGRNGDTVVSRDWQWNPQSGQVTLTVNDTTITYNRNQALDSLSISSDRSFVNDVYWLLPQFKLVWDQGTEITYLDEASDKIIRLKYTGDDGYTPGDQYDMTIDDNMMITSWKYYPSGSKEPAMETSFEDYNEYNGIKIASDHVTPDGSLQIFFTDIEIIK